MITTFEGNVGNCMMLLTLVDSKIDEMKNIVSTAFAEMKWVWWILWKNKYAGSEIIQMDKPICWIMHHHLRVNDTAFITVARLLQIEEITGEGKHRLYPNPIHLDFKMICVN